MTMKALEIARKRCIEVATQGGNRLDLSSLSLTEVPRELALCSSVQRLDLHGNSLTSVPKELSGFKLLEQLDLSGNPIGSLPDAITHLKNLAVLDLQRTRLSQLPDSLLKFEQLKTLYVGSAELKDLGLLRKLDKLEFLSIYFTAEECILPNLGGHSSLEHLMISRLRLDEIPDWIYKLHQLVTLMLPSNRIRSISPEIAQLQQLSRLDLRHNPIQELPINIGALSHLEELETTGCPLKRMPPEIVSQGSEAILSYLRDQYQQSHVHQWVSKLLIVGEGGVGKTSLLRRLRGEEYDPNESTTHGIAIRSLAMPHPTEHGVTMELKSWDFGGQQIYHATHQFFLTDRSLFLLVWNARLGHEQGRLYYWLDTIRARAPEAPVLLVATHVDERSVDLPLADLRARYPQIVDQYIVSNKTTNGIDKLLEAIRSQAAQLPLMGVRWPGPWLDAANGIRALADHQTHTTPQKLWALMGANGVPKESRPILAESLHQLGDILFFQGKPGLESIVLLDPHWATEAISRVLESQDVIEQRGIFTRAAMDEVWSDIDPHLRDYLLRLMEQFDLSYQTEDDRDVSIVVERLSHDAPAAMATRFDARLGQRELRMRFRIDGTLPAGIPTWFIARSHRFTTRTHFRRGALFADGLAETHLAVVQASPEARSVELAVRGPAPHAFFTLLRDGLELTLDRFRGLPVTCLIPCPGHAGMPCEHEFNYQDLEKRLGRKRFDIECPKAAAGDVDDPMVDVREMLFGLTSATIDEVHRKVEKLAENDRAQLAMIRSLTEIVQRNHYQLFRALQRHEETHCPSLFVLRPASEKSWTQKLLGQSVELHLVCEQPGEAHLTPDNGQYKTNLQAEWLGAIAPYITKMAAILKYTAPLIGVTTGYASEALEKMFSADLKLMESLIGKLPTIALESDSLSLGNRYGDESFERVEGATLRQLRNLLDKLDPQHKWGGLQKVLTMEGDYLWLCEKHAAKHRM